MFEADCMGIIEQMLSWLILKQMNQLTDDYSRLYVPSCLTGPEMVVKCRYTHVFKFTCVCVCMCVQVFMYIHTYIYIYTHIFKFLYIYAHIVKIL